LERETAAAVKYRVVLEPRREGGFTAIVPAFPLVRASGSTEEEALQSARSAIAASIEFAVEHQVAPDTRAGTAIQVNVTSGSVYRETSQLQLRGTTLALLISLAIEPRDVPMDVLCRRLYPQTPSDQAYNALKMAVYRARQQLGAADVIETTERGYALTDNAIVDIRFLPQIVRSIRARSIAKVLEDRLPGIFSELIEGRPAVFQTWEWFLPTERLLQRATREIGLYVGGRELHAGRPVVALDIARRLIMRDLLDEAAYELAIRSHLAMGNRASAMLEYRSYAGRLQEQMGIEPPPALRRLLDAAGQNGAAE
jgi:DNA-binding SARP family transcriptional activator/predicted RNase H-like HicB family nuclease